MSYLRSVVRDLGGPQEVAIRLCVSRNAVYNWMSTGIPASRALQLERMTNKPGLANALLETQRAGRASWRKS